MLLAAAIIPKCDYFFPSPSSPLMEKEGGESPLYSSSRETEKQNFNHDTELEKLYTHYDNGK